MNEILLLKMAHLLCLVFWLGGDLGVFYSSFYVADEKQSAAGRVVAAKILFGLDQGPRICMALILALGVQLAYSMGMLQIPVWSVALTWLVCLGWLGMVLILHFAAHSRDLSILTRFDWWFRITMILLLVFIPAVALSTGKPMMLPFVAYKLWVFAVLVAAGLMVRVKLKPFGPAFAKLASGQVDDAANLTIRKSLASVRPFVMVIWLGLLVNTALGLHLI